MTVTYRYCGFGLDFQSSIPIPELREGNIGQGKPVKIHMANAACPEGLIHIAPGVAAGPRSFWMEVPDVARLHVSDGSAISIELAHGASLADMRAYLLGSAMGALLHQRGFLPLHASAVEIDGNAVAFCGTSGAGKSSLALNLVKRGHRLLCDDICTIDLASGAPRLWPGLINLKLWRESLDAAGQEHAALEPVLPTLDKYKLPVSEAVEYSSYPLEHIFQLGVSNEQEPKTSSLHGAESLALLVANTFRGQLVSPMAQDRLHFQQCIETAKGARTHILSRPWIISQMSAACQAVELAVRTL